MQAVIVGLRLAGYPVELHYDGVTLCHFGSKPGGHHAATRDVIIGITATRLFPLPTLQGPLSSLPAGSILNIAVTRGGQTLELTVPTDAGRLQK